MLLWFVIQMASVLPVVPSLPHPALLAAWTVRAVGSPCGGTACTRAPAWGPWERKSWLLGGAAWQHLAANGVTRKECPPMEGKEELTDRLGEGPGLADAMPSWGIKREQPFCRRACGCWSQRLLVL